MSEQSQKSDVPKRGFTRRLGCYGMIIVWFLLLLAPCGLFYLATQGEVTITFQESPPQIVRIWLINEVERRGIGFSRPSLFVDVASQTACIQTDVQFLLWQGHADNLTTSYCECYSRDGDSWTFSGSSGGECQH